MNILEGMLDQPWFYWGMLVLLGMPTLFIIMGEVLRSMEQSESSFLPIAKNVRNILIPISVVYLLIGYVLEMDHSWLPFKIIKTLFWIILVDSSLKFVNALVFSDAIPKAQRDKIPKLLVDFLRVFIVLLSAAFVMSEVWGANLGSLLAALGVGSVVLGLALQDVLGGLFAGLALLSSKPFAVGDWIQIGDDDEIIGKVVSIDWRAVSLINHDQDTIVIPNAVIAKQQFHNYSRPKLSTMESVGFDFSFDDPPRKVKDMLLEIADQTPGILKQPKTTAAVISYDEFSVHYELRYFINDYDDVHLIRDDFVSRVWYASKRQGITFPTRAHEVFHYSGPDQQSASLITPNMLAHDISALGVLDVSKTDIEKLAQHGRLREYTRGECILAAGSIPMHFFIMLKGKVQEQNSDQLLFDESNHKFLLARGDFFGISGMIHKEPGERNIFANTDVSIIEVEISAMRNMLQVNPQVAQCLESIVESRTLRQA